MATKSALAAWMNQHTVNPLLLASVEAVGLAEHTAALQREGVALVVVMRRRRADRSSA